MEGERRDKKRKEFDNLISVYLFFICTASARLILSGRTNQIPVSVSPWTAVPLFHNDKVLVLYNLILKHALIIWNCSTTRNSEGRTGAICIIMMEIKGSGRWSNRRPCYFLKEKSAAAVAFKLCTKLIDTTSKKTHVWVQLVHKRSRSVNAPSSGTVTSESDVIVLA